MTERPEGIDPTDEYVEVEEPDTEADPEVAPDPYGDVESQDESDRGTPPAADVLSEDDVGERLRTLGLLSATSFVSLDGITRRSPRTPAQAVAWAARQVDHPSQGWKGVCLSFVAQCYGWGGAGVNTAWQSWQQTPERLCHYRGVPLAGALVYWRGGSRGFGHVAISAGSGRVYSTDIKRTGQVDRVTINTITRGWRMVYRGWCGPYFPHAW